MSRASESVPDPVTTTLGHRPGKVVAVHLNYPSRAAQRGKSPSAASYFLKPSTSLAGPGDVVRPAGTELLGFEGEIALVVGTPARHVRPQDGWSHVAWVTASNDLGLYDMRAADGGSNARSKGADGYTPVGPVLLAADALDPAGLRVRTWLDGDLVQEGATDDLLFDLGGLVADLSRFMTLETGDVVLTGTPAGASVARPGQVVEVEVDAPALGVTTGLLATRVVEGPEVEAWGSMPAVDDRVRADAWGTPPDRSGLSDDLRERLGKVAVATLSVQLRRLGYDDASIDGVRPLAPGRRLVGTARTLRYVPHRPDLFEALGGGYTRQKQVVDSLRPGEVLVMEARGDDTAGTLGDILALRAQVRGAAGVVTDGAARDAAAVVGTGLPVFAAGHHPAVLGRRHVPWEIDGTVSCGGATVQVGDVVVGDDDGVVVIPPALVDEVLAGAERTEREETWVAARVAEGAALDGLYPLSGHWREAYDADQPPDEGATD